MSRLPKLTPEQMTPEQKKVAEAIASGPRGGVRGPFEPLLHNPKAADVVQKLGAFARFEGKLANPLRELAILVTARHWTAQYEWFAHYKIALDVGLDKSIADAIGKREKPPFKTKDEEIVYNFAKELHEKFGQVSDQTFEAVRERFGNDGAVELVVLCGHYTVISMVLNTFQVQIASGEKPLS